MTSLSSVSSLLALAVFLLCGHYYFENKRRNPAGLPYPPGPKGYPIIGNLFDMPSEKEWLTFAEWGAKYGELTTAFSC